MAEEVDHTVRTLGLEKQSHLRCQVHLPGQVCPLLGLRLGLSPSAS